jgi:hypothetical protein
MFNRIKKFFKKIFSRPEVMPPMDPGTVPPLIVPEDTEIYGDLVVIKETETGRNIKFKDTVTGKLLTREEAADLIRAGKYPNYIVTKNGVVRSKPGVKNLG